MTFCTVNSYFRAKNEIEFVWGQNSMIPFLSLTLSQFVFTPQCIFDGNITAVQ